MKDIKSVEISVIVPVYNVARYLPRCLESISAQTSRNFELILIDDGSEDDSGKICDDYARDLNFACKVVHQANAGLSAARNCGIDMACGRFLLFVDSDDFIHPSAIEYLSDVCRRTMADIVEFDFFQVTDDEEVHWDDPWKESLSVWDSSEKLVRVLGSAESYPMSWNKLFRAKLFETIRFPHGKIHEDEFTTPFLADKAEVYIRSRAVLYAYVQRNGSIVNRAFSRARLDALEAFEFRFQYFHTLYNERYDAINAYSCLCCCDKLLKEGRSVLGDTELRRIESIAATMSLTVLRSKKNQLNLIRKIKALLFRLKYAAISEK